MEFLSDTGDRESPIDVLDEDKHDQYPFEIRHDQEVDVLEGQEIRPDIPEDIRMLLTWQERIYISFYLYLRKWRGIEGRSSPAMTPPWQIVISSLLAFLGIFVLSSAEYWILPDLKQENLIILTGAYAATAGKSLYMFNFILHEKYLHKNL